MDWMLEVEAEWHLSRCCRNVPRTLLCHFHNAVFVRVPSAVSQWMSLEVLLLWDKNNQMARQVIPSSIQRLMWHLCFFFQAERIAEYCTVFRLDLNTAWILNSFISITMRFLPTAKMLFSDWWTLNEIG